MTKWEYKLERFDLAVQSGGYKGVEATLNVAGAEGWEYVEVREVGVAGQIQSYPFIVLRRSVSVEA